MTALHHIPNRTKKLPPLRVGIGGPGGSGKTTLLEMLCKSMRQKWDLVAITNDIYTKEDQRLLTVSGALDAEALRWEVGEVVELRGRSAPTQLARPATVAAAGVDA